MNVFRTILIVATMLLFVPGIASAAATSTCPPGTPADRVCLESPIVPVTASAIIGTVIRGVLGFVGALTFVMFVWGGASWIFAAGNAEKIEQGTKTMIWAAIGLIVVFGSYILLGSIFDFLTGK